MAETDFESMVAGIDSNVEPGGFAIAAGVVVNNLDLIGEGRVQVRVPSMPGVQRVGAPHRDRRRVEPRVSSGCRATTTKCSSRSPRMTSATRTCSAAMEHGESSARSDRVQAIVPSGHSRRVSRRASATRSSSTTRCNRSRSPLEHAAEGHDRPAQDRADERRRHADHQAGQHVAIDFDPGGGEAGAEGAADFDRRPAGRVEGHDDQRASRRAVQRHRPADQVELTKERPCRLPQESEIRRAIRE